MTNTEILDSLKQEIECFEANLDTWIKTYEGHYALIKGCELKGTFTTNEEAYNEGVKLFGNMPFLIKRIEKKAPIQQLPALSIGLICAHV